MPLVNLVLVGIIILKTRHAALDFAPVAGQHRLRLLFLLNQLLKSACPNVCFRHRAARPLERRDDIG